MAFKMKSGNKPEFKSMGGEPSPMKWGRLGKAFNKVNKAIGDTVKKTFGGKKRSGGGGGSFANKAAEMKEKYQRMQEQAPQEASASGPQRRGASLAEKSRDAEEAKANKEMSKKEMWSTAMEKWKNMSARDRHEKYGMGGGAGGMAMGFANFMSEEGRAYQAKQTGEKMPDSPQERGGISNALRQSLGLMSDIRLKENIENIGKSKSGIPIYKFNYIGDNSKYSGAMAQDLLKIKPEAVTIDKNFGYYKVDYNNIDVDMRLLN